MFKVYGSKLCPDCINLKGNFDKYHIEYEYIDILDSLRNLKEFLDLRDHLSVFDHSKEIGDIGLPALVREDGSVFLSWEKYLEDKGYKVEEYAMSLKQCSIDGKGC